MSSAHSDPIIPQWRAEAELAAIEERFFGLFDSPVYHLALREVLGRDPEGRLVAFASAPEEAQRELVESIYARLLAQQHALPASPQRTKSAIRTHLRALPSLDRAVTRKMLALPKRARLLTFLKRIFRRRPTASA